MDVFVRYKCETCNGEGLIADGLWKKFYEADEAFSKQNGRDMSEDEVIAWFNNEGHYGSLPPEERTCQDCDGKGDVESWMDAREFLLKYIAHIKSEQS